MDFYTDSPLAAAKCYSGVQKSTRGGSQGDAPDSAPVHKEARPAILYGMLSWMTQRDGDLGIYA